MALTATPYGHVGMHLASGGLDPATLKVMLVDGTYTADLAAHEFKSSVTGEVTGSGYTAGGAALANAAWSYDATSAESRLTADDTSWDATGGELVANGAVVYSAGTGDADSVLVAYVAFGQAVTASNVALTLDWDNTRGVLVLAA